jgi:hypothetical protein
MSEWQHRARTVAEDLAKLGFPFTAEDIRARTGDPADPHEVGAVLMTLHTRKQIRPTGVYRRSKRKTSRSSLIAEWVGLKDKS